MSAQTLTIGAPANRITEFLSDDTLRSAAPTIFAERPHSSRSDRYQFIPTAKIVEGLRKEGFLPTQVQVTRTKGGHVGYEKHLIRFRPVGELAVDGLFPEVVLVNSHDGSTAYQLLAGLFRLVCLNGLVRSTGIEDQVHVKHAGNNIVDDVIEGSYRILDHAKLGVEKAETWGKLQLTDQESTALAVAAHHVRFADSDGYVHTAIRPEQLLHPRRSEDNKNDLWTTFNRLQENSIKGGQIAPGARRRVRARGVTSIDGSLKLNQALWKLSQALADHKINGTPLVLDETAV